jgi:hypothetical protein
MTGRMGEKMSADVNDDGVTPRHMPICAWCFSFRPFVHPLLLRPGDIVPVVLSLAN